MNNTAQINTDNIATVQRLYQAFFDHDFTAILEMLSTDVEWGEPSNPFNPSGGVRFGHEGFLEWLKTGNEAEEILSLDIKKFLANEDAVAVTGFTKCRVRKTNKTYETDFVHLLTFRENKIIRFREFFDTYIAAEAFRS